MSAEEFTPITRSQVLLPFFDDPQLNLATEALWNEYPVLRSLLGRIVEEDPCFDKESFKSVIVDTYREEFSDPFILEFIDVLNLLYNTRLSEAVREASSFCACRIIIVLSPSS